ncbi:Outer membrane protein TolC [bacterium HR21]|nr:Outer membrane protein TolC [bacterium HR21]
MVSMIGRWAFLAAVAVSLSFGQQPLRLSLQRALQWAVERNTELQLARLEIERADARVQEAVGTALPSVGVAANFTRNLLLPVFFLPDFRNPQSGQLQAVKIGSENAFQLQLQATQVLFSQAVLTGIGASQVYAQAARQQYRATLARTIAEVKKAFYAALLARELWQAAQASLRRAERFAEDAQVLASQGLVADYDALRARVQLEQVRTLVAQAELGYTAALRQLKLLVGVPQEQDIELEGSLEAEYRPEELPEAETLVRQALQRNPQLQALQLQEVLQRDVVRLYRAESYPTLVGFGTYVYQGQSPTLSNFLTARSMAVGIQLSVSLFQGLQTKARVEQAEIEQHKVQQQLEQFREGLKVQVLLALQRQQLARQRLEVARSTIAQAERGYEIARTRYSEGLGSQLEITDADATIRQAQSAYAQALHDYLAAQADLEYLTGSVDLAQFGS